MKAVVYTEYGSPEVLKLKEVAKPTPKDDEVLIKVHATSVTSGDCNGRNFVFVPNGFKFLARLMFGLNKPKKGILGLEFAGEIEAVGEEVNTFQVGDTIFGLDGTDMGSYAEYKAMTVKRGISTKPDNISYQEIVAMSNGALTAYSYLKHKGNIQAGHKVLVVGASGSVGSAGVQIAKHFGAEVTGVCSTKNIELVKSLGADNVIDYTQEDFTQSNETYDLILETVGTTSFDDCKHNLTPDGKYLGVAGGMKELRQMFWTSLFSKKKVLAGPASEKTEDLNFIKDLIKAKKLKPVIDRCYPLEQIVEAHRYVDSGRKRGNVVISIIQQEKP